MFGSPVISDLRAVFELAPQGIEFDLERASLAPFAPLTHALASRLPFATLGAETFILYANQRKGRALGMLQARLRKNRPEAELTFISPALEQDPDAVTTWYRLLAEATNGLGELGCQRIFVQVVGSGDGGRGNGVEEVFRRSGFTAYTREDIYGLSGERLAGLRAALGPSQLRRQRKRDSWNLLRLYTSATPRPVQLAEGMLTLEGGQCDGCASWEQLNGVGYILESNDELVGIVRLFRRRSGNWLRFYLHPLAQGQADRLIREGLALIARSRTRPVFVPVRDYEVGVRGGLEQLGFEPRLHRTLLVKHTTVRVKEALPWLAPVLESPSVPAVQSSHQARELETKTA